MPTVCKSMVLVTAFLAGVAIAACADPLFHPYRSPGPQIAALSSASVAPAPDSETLLEANVFGPQRAGASYKVPHVDAKDR
jgi:hypothetical protein